MVFAIMELARWLRRLVDLRPFVMYAETQAVAALIGAACVSVLRLPLTSVMIAALLCAKAGLAVAPLIVVAVAVAYLTSETLTAFVDARVGADRVLEAADGLVASAPPAV